MKKLSFLTILLLVCGAVCGCTPAEPQPVQQPLPEIPTTLYAIDKITPVCMEELEKQVARLDRNDFFHPDRIALFEKHGTYISVDNICLQDCNTITFDIVLTKTNGTTRTMPATGLLMYRYLPMDEECIYDLQVLWGNLSICDNVIVMANIDDLSLWRSDIAYAKRSDFFFIQDVVKNRDGYLLPYFSGDSSGFINIAVSGKVTDIPLLITEDTNRTFGTHKLMESRCFNTTARAATRMDCFYGDENEKQIFMSFDRENEYYGLDYAMYDFERNVFLTSYKTITYKTQDCRYEIYAMCFENGSFYIDDETFFVAVKKVNGMTADRVVFKSDINPRTFGTDTRTGWNNHTHISLSKDMNTLSIGCDKSNTVINIDFLQDTAHTVKNAPMPHMQEVDNSPNSHHMLYLTENNGRNYLTSRIMSGYCRMNNIAQITGQWGTDWLAGFYTHNYIYVLTENSFSVYSWEGDNHWKPVVVKSGSYEVNSENAKRLCSYYI